MMTKGKRIISAILALTMVMSFSTVFAGAVYTESRTKAHELKNEVTDDETKAKISVAEVQLDLEALEDRMIEVGCLSIYGVNEDGNVVYSYTDEDDAEVSYIDTWTDEEGGTCIRFDENDIVNILCFKPDGSIYLDGAKVEVKTTSNNVVGGIEPMANAYSYFSTTPYANTNFVDYTGTARLLYDSTAITNLANTLSKLGVDVVTTLVLNVWGSMVSKLGQTFCKQVVKKSVSVAIKSSADATGLTFKDYRRPHPSNDTLRMLYRHDVHATPNVGTASVTYYYEDRRAT